MVMEWNEYVKLFDEILEGKITGAPYDQEDFLKYVSLNKMRQNRCRVGTCFTIIHILYKYLKCYKL